jgi:serine/threonine protein kinase/Tol biopolymer transport system component
MALQAGTRLGPYQVLSLIGAGGMGEVYRAVDTRLDRSVAVKVLAPELAGDAEFRARFTREAKAISALNHPHICGLHDIGRAQDIEYLVLELLEGETLAARLERGALPLAQVLRFGIEIADALEAAHRLGIIHRDLKPGNVMLTPAGTKLLDFGLAKHTVGAAGQAFSMLATAPGTGTAQGTFIGTLPYMAPEQVQGQPADARTDIFAFGALLYEMATGRRAFEATTQASLIAKILETEPAVVSSLAPLTPPALDHVVQGCLAKAPADRWQTAHDVKMHLQWIHALGSRTGLAPSVAVPQRRKGWVPWTLVAVACAALVGMALPRSSSRLPPATPARFEVTLPDDLHIDSTSDRAEMSPDGQRLVFSAEVNGRQQLFIRDLASTGLLGLDDTEDGYFPFWSPDSKSLAFFARGKLKRTGVTGGRPRVLAEAAGWLRSLTGGGTWTDGTILFAISDGSIVRVDDTGGKVTRVDTVPWKAGENAFVWPRFLPDGRHFLVSKVGDPALYVASLDAIGMQQVAEEGSRAIYAAGRLVFFRGASVFARPFDPERFAFTGPEKKLIDRAAFFSASHTGTIVYRPDRITPSQITWFDRRGRRTATLSEPGPYLQVVLSPRGHRATLVRSDTLEVAQAQADTDLWDVDVASGIASRLTSDPTIDTDPAWAPDEHQMAFGSRRTGAMGVFVKDVNSGAEKPLVAWKEPVFVDEWTPDGRFIIFHSSAGRAVWAMPVGGDRKPRMLANTAYTMDEVHVSPDGRWVAYNGDESGRLEVYVAKFPEFTAKRQISSAGGVQPQWRGDGMELFYLGTDRTMMSVRVTAGAEFVGSPPSPLFPTRLAPNPGRPQYAVTRDGQRFLGLERVEEERHTMTFLLNWLNANSADVSTPVR